MELILQAEVIIQIHEGENPTAECNTFLGELLLGGISLTCADNIFKI